MRYCNNETTAACIIVFNNTNVIAIFEIAHINGYSCISRQNIGYIHLIHQCSVDCVNFNYRITGYISRNGNLSH